jgi:glycosyltransferase involved in cell wall biosynthesis
VKKVLVLNFFPAFVPPSSGGELRYFNMYSHLSGSFDVTLLSPTYAEHTFEIVQHSATFREYRIPKDESIHHRLHHRLDEEGVCAEVSALACALSSSYPNAYHRYYFELYERADIIVHEFPYMVEYDMMWGFDDKPRVYNSHNVEYLLMRQLYRGQKAGAYLQYIHGLEKKLATRSALVFATSQEEKGAFVELYGVSPGKVALAPNGIEPADLTRVAGNGNKTVLFIGSQHPPNVEAVDFIIQEVAPECPEVEFLIAGSCGAPFSQKPRRGNVRLLGRIDEKTKRDLFMHVDVAINPMFSGAGTNLKTLEYLSFGIPLVSTDVGVRGLNLQDGEHFLKADKKNFAEKIRELIAHAEMREKISCSGQFFVTENYSWESISREVRDKLDMLPLEGKGNRKRVVLLNDYPVSHPTGGGEIRINSLHGALSRYCDIVLLCLNNSTQITTAQITRTFTEISFPKTPEHSAEEERVNSMHWISAGDVVSSYMVVENPFYMAALKTFHGTADLIVLQHPYLMPALNLLGGKPLIYESHNFESGLKKELLKDHPLSGKLIAQVEVVEREASRRSALVLGVSKEDIAHLAEFSRIEERYFHLIRNGVEIRDELFPRETYEEVKKILRGRRSVLFIGSGHVPNVTALNFIITSLAPALPQALFFVIGTACYAFRQDQVPENVLLFGRLDDKYKECLLRIADVAINPVVEGSGSNLKLAEYLAYKIPTVTTMMGARGYEIEDGREVLISDLQEFAGRVEYLLGNDGAREALANQGYVYARRELGWNVLADEYFSILSNTVFKTGKKKLLVLTYRFTDPPLGGAEMYLLKVIRELDRLGDFTITVATTDIRDIFNKFHFSIEFTRDDGIPLLPGLSNTSVHKFRCDRVADGQRLETSRRLFERWMEEFVLSSLRHVDKYTFPMLMGGWHFPECREKRCEIWSAGAAVICVAGADEIEIKGRCPRSDGLAFSSDMGTFDTKRVNGDFQIVLKTSGCKWVKLSTGVSRFGDEARPLGVRVVSVRYKRGGKWHGLRLDYNYRDYLKERCPGEYVEELIRIAETRSEEFDRLFQEARGPASAELEEWLDRNTEKFDVVLGHSVPFSTSVLASQHGRRSGRPVVILPHFHADDEFYHWKSYYEALQSASAVFASPRSSIELFFDKIGANTVYLPGGIDPGEYEKTDVGAFMSVFSKDLPFFLVLGRKATAKNYRWAIDAVREVNAEGKVCDLLIIGRDEDGQPIDRNGAVYLGEQDRSVVLAALKECTALINMSESESFGIVVLEAWMQKRPVIVNEKCGAFVELVEDGVNGVTAYRETLAGEIRSILRDPIRAREMGERGFEEVSEKYTWEAIGKKANQALLAALGAAAPRERTK